MAGEGRRAAPYAAAVELTAGLQADRVDPGPAAAHAPWIRPLECYGWRTTSEIHGAALRLVR